MTNFRGWTHTIGGILTVYLFQLGNIYWVHTQIKWKHQTGEWGNRFSLWCTGISWASWPEPADHTKGCRVGGGLRRISWTQLCPTSQFRRRQQRCNILEDLLCICQDLWILWIPYTVNIVNSYSNTKSWRLQSLASDAASSLLLCPL